ncbi:MAG: formylglycine-generating enzyme family protein, partial [Acetobacteraceae bacterium]|nr:formylglycine-generating enzyme family protein [Acetobacteraceae bacterium]
PVHDVTIAKPFAIGVFEVTLEDYYRFAVATGRAKPGDAGWDQGRLPVIVSWDNACAYAEWLTQQTGKRYRLPSEAEWEYACRAGSTTRFSFGDDMARLGEFAWYKDNSGGQTHPVGQKRPNAFGLYDMHGNVWEWVEDCWRDSYAGAPTDGSPWISGACRDRVLRGGN